MSVSNETNVIISCNKVSLYILSMFSSIFASSEKWGYKQKPPCVMLMLQKNLCEK